MDWIAFSIRLLGLYYNGIKKRDLLGDPYRIEFLMAGSGGLAAPSLLDIELAAVVMSLALIGTNACNYRKWSRESFVPVPGTHDSV